LKIRPTVGGMRGSGCAERPWRDREERLVDKGGLSTLHWSPFRSLADSWRGDEVPSIPGLYRIRRISRNDLDYVGQTGGSLRKRLAMLVGVYAPIMPYGDPHVAAPALWGFRDSLGCEFEVSVAPLDGPAPMRKAWEAVTIALYRQEHRTSPTVCFGRGPVGYRLSSHNNATIVAAGRRFQGGKCDETLACHEPGIPPAGSLTGDPHGPTWGGHEWEPWRPVGAAVTSILRGSLGLYRIRGTEASTFVYVGEGLIRSRLAAHFAKITDLKNRQGQVFAHAGLLECAWVINANWRPHQRLELETDLIAAHVLATNSPPAAQFLG
jgi:hypothetical protein